MKWAIREAVDVYFKAKSVFKLGARTIRAGEPVLIFDTVKTSTFEVAAEMSYVTGGRGNARILSYEGDKTLTFQFEDALLSTEGMALLAGADLIPARNKHLKGSPSNAKSIISHFTERYAVTTGNTADIDPANVYASDPSIPGIPRGGVDNVWLKRKPYVGQNATLYIMLLDRAGEVSGSPLEINLATTSNRTDLVNYDDTKSYLHKFYPGDAFVAFNTAGMPITRAKFDHPTSDTKCAEFDDQVAHYVDYKSALDNWSSSWPAISTCVRAITTTGMVGGGTGVSGGGHWGDVGGGKTPYPYLLGPGTISQPKAFKEGAQIVYKVNVPSILYQDIVLADYYIEYMHDATQVSILPDKFAPYMYVEGSSLVRRASDGMDLPVEFVIPKFKVTTALSFTLQSTGDASTFTFQGDAYPDFSKFDLTRKVLADIQILDADDNYDAASGDGEIADPTSYRRFKYNEDTEGEYLWKDPSMEAHQNIDYSDTGDYVPSHGGPATRTPGAGVIDSLIQGKLFMTMKSASKTIDIPIERPYDYKYKIDWDDGTIEIVEGLGELGNKVSHTYLVADKEYNVMVQALNDYGHAALGHEISSGIGLSNIIKLMGVFQGNTIDDIWEDAGQSLFYGISSLKDVDVQFLNFEKATGNIFSGMFSGCTGLTSLPANFQLPAVPNGTSNIFNTMFEECTGLTSLPANFQLPAVPNGTDNIFAYMFSGCTGLTSLPANFQLPAVPNGTSAIFNNMFVGCTGLTSLPANFQLPAVPNGTSGIFNSMFSGCTNLIHNIETGLFSGPINPTAVQINNSGFNYMFNNCSKITGNLASGNVYTKLISKVPTPATDKNTFSGCTLLTGYTTLHANWK